MLADFSFATNLLERRGCVESANQCGQLDLSRDSILYPADHHGPSSNVGSAGLAFARHMMPISFILLICGRFCSCGIILLGMHHCKIGAA